MTPLYKQNTPKLMLFVVFTLLFCVSYAYGITYSYKQDINNQDASNVSLAYFKQGQQFIANTTSIDTIIINIAKKGTAPTVNLTFYLYNDSNNIYNTSLYNTSTQINGNTLTTNWQNITVNVNWNGLIIGNKYWLLMDGRTVDSSNAFIVGTWNDSYNMGVRNIYSDSTNRSTYNYALRIYDIGQSLSYSVSSAAANYQTPITPFYDLLGIITANYNSSNATIDYCDVWYLNGALNRSEVCYYNYTGNKAFNLSTIPTSNLANGQVWTYGVTGFLSSNYSINFSYTNATPLTIGGYGIDNCSNSFGITSNATSKYYQFLTTSKSLINVNLSGSIIYEGITLVIPPTLANSSRFCIYPNWITLQGELSLQYLYGADLYTYSFIGDFNNITQYLNFTIEVGTTDVTATVFDNTGAEIEGAYIFPQMYDTATGNYISIGSFTTNFEGKTVIPLTLNLVKYKFLIYYPFETLLETTTPTYIYSNAISFYVNTQQEVAEDFFKSENLASTLSYNENTYTFTYVFLDTNNEVTQGCLDIYLLSNATNLSYSSTCVSGATGTINSVIVNNSGANYLAKASVTLKGNIIPMESLSKYFPGNTVQTIGYMGLLADLLLTIAMSFIFFFSVPIAILMIPLPTVMLSSIGFIAVDPAIAWGMELGALVLAVIINKRS